MANGIIVTILRTAVEDRATLGSDPSATAALYGMGGIRSGAAFSYGYAVGSKAINPSSVK